MTRFWWRMKPARRQILVAALASGAALVLATGLAGAELIYFLWKPIGPAPSCCFFPGGDTGRATAIAVNPVNEDDVWLGTAGGGVWRSTNAGVSWSPMSDDQASLAIGSIALAGCSPSHCTAVYAGTGENAIRRDTYYGQGLLVGAFDGSQIVWTHRTGAPAYRFNRGNITNVVLDPTTSGPGQVLYITLSSGVTASATESTVTAPEPLGGYGIYKSVDNGASFTKVWSGGRPTDLEIDRLDHNVLYAGVLGQGIFRSVDAGATWCPLNAGIPQPPGCNIPYTGLPDLNNWTIDHVEIATDPILPQAQSHLFATFGRCPDPLLDNCAPALYESSNGGNTWTQRHGGQGFHYLGSESIPPCPFGYTRYTHALTVDPSNPGAVFVGGIHLCRWSQATLWQAADHSALPCASNPIGEQTVNRCTLHYDHRAVAFAPSDPLRAYDASDGGFAVSTDGGDTWTARNNGLGIVEFQSIASSPFSDSIIGGTQDNAGMEWVGSFLWNHLECCGDAGFAVMERDPTPTSKQDDMYITSNTGEVGETIVLPIRSVDGGAIFQWAPTNYGYDDGINNNDVRSFYPPLVEDHTFKLYFGTSALFRSTNGSESYTAISPVLSSLDEPEIVGGKDVITAVAVAPTNADHVYIGLYSGKTFYSTAPCSGSGCWTAGTVLTGPVTWIAVDSWDENVAYATISGFAKGGHVYKTPDGGQTWSKLPTTRQLSGVPANTLLVNPPNPQVLWLGTDKGVYRSINGGYSWARFSLGLPNVPVYAFTFTESGGALVAATHGRGAWILSGHKLKEFVDGPNQEFIIEEALVGHGFLPEQDCVLTITRQDGSVCASGPSDALGGRVRTDSQGFLVSSKPGFYSGLPIVWACSQGKCLGSDALSCNRSGNPMAAVQAACGSQIARSDVDRSQSHDDPPSAVLGLGSFAPAGTGFAVAGGPSAAAPSGSFTLSPAIQAGDGSTRLLCSIGVALQAGDTSADVLQRASAAVNGDPACREAGVSARFQSGDRGRMSEDLFPVVDRLALEAPLLHGSRLVPAVQGAPGGVTDLCFRIGRIDRPSRSQILGMRLRFATGRTGAAGGAIHVTERSALGECSIVASIPVGGQAGDVAQAVAAAFQTPGIPGPFPACPARANPRDVSRQGDSVLSSFASEVEICVADVGVGVSLAPEEICFAPADCDDGNPCTADACSGAGQCTHAAVTDGAPCTDANLCTLGNACIAGVCGVPRVCDDGNVCTDDACDPVTGACLTPAPPIVCDDGNVCTLDKCDAATGRCVFAPLTGSCSDGDPCTSGDTCVLQPGTPVPACTGTFGCDDSDPCTADSCDPLTGACASEAIDCDDGHPCTLDQCQAGACLSSVVTGVPCDDDDRCTTGDRCEIDPFGQPVCSGVTTSCDDGIACTVDACDAVTGGCTHAPAAIGTVSLLSLLDQSRLAWSTEPGALAYDSYRGTIPKPGLGSRPPASRYDQTCFEAHDAAGDGATLSTDAGIPTLGTAFYYLASEVAACGEGPIGHDSNGTLIPNSAPCPP